MARIKITINGELGLISASRFLNVLGYSLSLLKDLDKHFTESRTGSISWVVSGIGHGSNAFVELESRMIKGETDNSEKVKDAFTEGLYTIEYQKASPKHFSTSMLQRVQKMVREFGKDGIRGVNFSDDISKKIDLNVEAEKILNDLVGAKYKAIGSIEGRIELISIHKHGRRFDIYQSRTEKAVRCSFPDDIEANVFKAAEERRRVIVSGIISYNFKNEPISILIKPPIRLLKNDNELPSIEQIRGLDPDITGDLNTEDYIRSIRE